MPISLKTLASSSASVTFPYAGDSVTVVYYPVRVTEKTIAQMQVFVESDEANIGPGFASFNDVLVHLVKSWDVYEDEAQTVMFPLEAERLADLPIAFRMSVLNAIMGDIRPEAMAPQVVVMIGSH